ncbi:MAG: hypothetical protein A3D92_19390 [Bacteroidetes bacterium RIFCSPHIGHO2_02_FULL_44_7]|nr:MAG: hypothetical protein A3D92_19390 [Bacteroidetes bacterium RIFCSPHIGHO2_02_FULL_44_7]
MKKNKTILDREPVSSDYIASHQNFGQVINQVNQLSVPVWKTGWFYGPIGMAVVAVAVSVVTIDPASAESTAAHTNIATTSFQNSLVDQVEHPPARVEEVTPEVEPTPSPAIDLPVERSETSTVVTVPTQVEVQVVTEPVNATPPSVAGTGKKNILPHIGNYFLGEIPVSDLTLPLECNDDIRIIAFNVHFNTTNGTETASIIGNKVPQKIVDVIKAHNIGYMVSFTDIKGKTSEGKVVSLLPMNFVATNPR